MVTGNILEIKQRTRIRVLQAVTPVYIVVLLSAHDMLTLAQRKQKILQLERQLEFLEIESTVSTTYL